jgi:uncharacterized membrane protein YidH (DUF202 family)
MTKTRRRVLGISLVGIAILMIIYAGLKYAGTDVLDDPGTILISADKSYPVVWSAIIGVVLFVSGIGILITGKLKG